MTTRHKSKMTVLYYTYYSFSVRFTFVSTEDLQSHVLDLEEANESSCSKLSQAEKEIEILKDENEKLRRAFARFNDADLEHENRTLRQQVCTCIIFVIILIIFDDSASPSIVTVAITIIININQSIKF